MPNLVTWKIQIIYYNPIHLCPKTPIIAIDETLIFMPQGYREESLHTF
jgi:hypothetical protein